ncbi:hypothetical protein [Segatella albensis]|nr:hypothetical protein [Segatella albensis]
MKFLRFLFSSILLKSGKNRRDDNDLYDDYYDEDYDEDFDEL